MTMSNGKVGEQTLEAIKEAEKIPDFEYKVPNEVQFFAIVETAAEHVVARTKALAQLEACKIMTHPNKDALQQQADFSKIMIGRGWLLVKELGYSQKDYTDALDDLLSSRVPQFAKGKA